MAFLAGPRNGTLTQIQAASADGSSNPQSNYDLTGNTTPVTPTPGAVKWSGRADAFIQERKARVNNSGTVDFVKYVNVSIPYGLKTDAVVVEVASGDILTVVDKQGTEAVYVVREAIHSKGNVSICPRIKCIIQA